MFRFAFLRFPPCPTEPAMKAILPAVAAAAFLLSFGCASCPDKKCDKCGTPECKCPHVCAKCGKTPCVCPK